MVSTTRQRRASPACREGADKIIESIRYEVAEDRREAFEGAYAEAQASLRASSHCRAWELARCVAEPASYILRIEWDSVEGHLQGFRQIAEFRTLFAAIRSYVNDIREMRHYEHTAVAGAKLLAQAGSCRGRCCQIEPSGSWARGER